MPRSGLSGGVQIVVTGIDAATVHAGLSRLERALTGSGLANFFATAVTPYLQERARERFASEGDDAVGAWAPLRLFTQNIRASQGYGPAHPINRRTGELENYITNSPPAITTGPDGGVLRYPGRTAGGELGRKVSTAQIGLPGGRIMADTVPRPVLGVSSTDLEAVLYGLMMHIAGTP